MTEQQYVPHLRKIGERQIADFLEDLMREIDTHEKMFLELCRVKRERDALLLGGVPREEHELLLKRFRHLLESDFIRSFDAYDPKTGTYKRDISEADRVAYVVRCGWCKRSSVTKISDYSTNIDGAPMWVMYCDLRNHVVGPECFCSDGVPREVKADG